MRRPGEVVPIAVLLLATHAARAEPAQQVDDLEVLEFLGEWATDDGGWMDPDVLSDEEETGSAEQVQTGDEHEFDEPL